MRKILKSLLICFIMLFGFIALGCGEAAATTPPGDSSGVVEENPSVTPDPAPTNPVDPAPVTPDDPKPEEPKPEEPKPEKPNVDYSAVVEALKDFLLNEYTVVYTDEFAEEPGEDCLELSVNASDADLLGSIQIILEDFEYNGFSVSCKQVEDKIVFVITAD